MTNNISAPIENLSRLSDQDCALVMEKYLLESLEIEDPAYFEEEMLTKFINIDYSLREGLCKLLNFSLKRNTQKISGISINAWLKRYLEKYARIPREPGTFLRYVTSNPEIQRLNENDQKRLMRIFRLYDYLLVEPVPDLDCPQAINLMRFPMRLSTPLRELLAEMSSNQTEKTYSSQTVSERLPVKAVLQKFPKIGEQAVTNSPIKLKSFDSPVRPSIRNWLYDYTSHLGQTNHSSMDRTNYLFRSENAINLSSPEKEKLSIILRSFDENTPLPIDAGRQEVVFEELARKKPPRTPQTEAPLQPKTAPSINFIHHVERQPVWQDSPAKKIFAQPEKKPVPESFVKPYSRMEPPKKTIINQSPVFPLTRKSESNSSKLNLSEIPRDNAPGDSPPSPNFNMTFTNPYPAPGTHESKFEQTNDNIANVSFSEGIPKAPVARVSTRRIPETRPAPSASFVPKAVPTQQKPAPIIPQTPRPIYQRPQPNRNVIYPHLANEFPAGKPEPKIKGNTVDLSNTKR